MTVDRAFTEQINRLASVFGQNAFSPERVRRIHRFIGDLPEDALREIANNIIDSSRYAPLPKDFLDASKAWRRSFFDKHGYAWGYGPASKPNAEIEFECTQCLDAGLLQLQEVGGGEFVICRCTCSMGETQDKGLPQWSSDFRGLFTKGPLSSEWVKPQGPGSHGLQGRIDFLKAQIRKAKRYWNGGSNEDTKQHNQRNGWG